MKILKSCAQQKNRTKEQDQPGFAKLDENNYSELSQLNLLKKHLWNG
tara:strand:- start:530 stop:670 length:141 start_codon:yes stop_codon:yes gene_type:complete